MKKTSLLAMVLALVMLLSGCSLIAKNPDVDAATEIIRLGDKVITKGQMSSVIDYQLDYMAYYYSLFGYQLDPTDPAIIADVRNDVIRQYQESMVMEQQVAALGLDALTDEEKATVDADVEKEYNEYFDSFKSRFADLEGDELTKAAEEAMAKEGITKESVTESVTNSFLSKKLKEYVIKDVTVSEDEIKADFDAKVEADKTAYAENANSFVNAMNNGTTLYYAPEGVRLVKQILIKYTDEDQQKIDDLNSRISAARLADGTEETPAENAEELEAQLAEVKKTALANIDAAADDVIAQLEAGADWDALMAEKTQDPGMQSGATAEKGYAVCEGMTNFDPAFVSAAMALEKIGDVSPKTAGDAYGYYIIRYVGDVTPGEQVTLDSVKDSIAESLLTAKQNDLYKTTVDTWVNEAKFVMNTKALDD